MLKKVQCKNILYYYDEHKNNIILIVEDVPLNILFEFLNI